MKYFTSLFEYVSHNNAQTLLEINCGVACFDKVVKTAETYKLSVQKWSGNQTSVASRTNISNDWINCESFKFCIDLFLNNEFLLQAAKYGVSFRNDRIEEFDYERIIARFAEFGFYYDDTKSLNLVRPEDKMIMLFVRGQREEEALPFAKPTKNAIGIHLVLRMVENIEYLREWIGYHLNLGVDKFFVHDNSNSVKSEMTAYDYLVTAETTKIGLNLACFNKTRFQIKQKWE